jgi:MFS family permease
LASREHTEAIAGQLPGSAAKLESKTIQKLQIRLIPYLFLLYVVAMIDRINIGFAQLTMNKDLGLSSQQFSTAAGIFFIGYFLFEIPSNLILHRVGARVWIARILLSWGLVASLTGLVQSVHQLYGARVVLGFAEAGYYPGIVLYLTYWFRQKEQARVLSLFLTGFAVNSVLGSPISGFILQHVHWLGVASWRWLFILEGLPAIALGFFTYLVLPNRPSEAKFLTAEEKEWLQTELQREEARKPAGRHSALDGITNLRVWHLAAIYFGMMIGAYTLSFYAPKLVESLSSEYSYSLVGYMVMIPFLAAFVVMILVGRSSDRRMERRYHAAACLLVGAIGFLSLGWVHSPFVTIVLLSLLAIGYCSSLGPFWAMPGGFLTGFSAASGIAFINSVGNLGGFFGPSMVGFITEKTGTLHGGLAFVGVSMLVAAALVLLLPRVASVRIPVEVKANQ